MEKVKKSMLSLGEPELIAEYEMKWIELNNNKKTIKESIENFKTNNIQETLYEPLEKTLFVFDNMLNIWDKYDTDTKQLLFNSVFE
ncbi:MAG: hypothetical protein WCL02_08855 [bacterium]